MAPNAIIPVAVAMLRTFLTFAWIATSRAATRGIFRTFQSSPESAGLPEMSAIGVDRMVLEP